MLHKHFTKYLLERDTILATIGVFIFLVLLGMIPINFYVLNPMKTALKDFDFNDIAYSKLGKAEATRTDSNIVVLNIGNADREGIAYIIDKVSSLGPKVIGLDVLFEGEREPEKDSLLRQVLENTPNLVAVSRLIPEKEGFSVDSNYFDSSLKKRGYANLIGEEVGTIRYYSPFEVIGATKYPHITSAIVKEFDPAAYEKLVKRHKSVETINYARRVHQYKVINAEDLMMGQVEDYVLKDKIVLLGLINLDPNNIEDKKFTPMNPKVAGKSTPDMNGVIVQANIISMVLEGNYIIKMKKWVAWIVAIIIGWLHMSLFVRYYLEDHIWFHLVAKLAQVFSAILFAYLGIWLFDKFGIKLDMKYTLYVIVLAVDIIYFYEAFAVWLHKKTGFQTLFHHHSHH